jgi:ABC-type Fe3+-siderophore transport system permease subunit
MVDYSKMLGGDNFLSFAVGIRIAGMPRSISTFMYGVISWVGILVSTIARVGWSER